MLLEQGGTSSFSFVLQMKCVENSFKRFLHLFTLRKALLWLSSEPYEEWGIWGTTPGGDGESCIGNPILGLAKSTDCLYPVHVKHSL